MSYAGEAAALDGEVLAAIAGWRAGADLSEAEFDDLARRMFAFQMRYNEPYARFARRRGFGEDRLPAHWQQIPAVPSSAFKDAVLATFAAERAALRFETSGTTAASSGTHYLESPQLYDAALLAGFEFFVIAGAPRLRYVLLVPDPRERPQSSLGYMLARIVREAQAPHGWYVHGEAIDTPGALADLERAERERVPVCIATTAFALVHLLDACAQDGRTFDLAPGSRMMETGGFKGRSRTVDRQTLYGQAARTFGLPAGAIVAEYGMTELCSQYYDARGSDAGAPVKAGPPWLRCYAVDPAGALLAPGEIGRLVHVDLANRSSALAVLTDDVGYRVNAAHAGPTPFVLLGRPADAPLRGCSLDAEALRALR